jgi:putative phosphoesterase
MKILILADIHANWPALAAIRERFDACLFLGDLVDYATDPVPCIDWVSAQGAISVRGNHDHAVAQQVSVSKGGGFRALAAATRPVHWKVLDPPRIKYLARLPVTRQVQLDGKSFYLVHATPRDPLDEYLVNDREAWKARLGSINADYVCVGHSHVPFHIDFGRLQLINPGSVGQPRDGDPRCSYAVLENGRLEFRRVEYDIDATLRQMRECGVGGWALELAEAVLRSGGRLDDAAVRAGDGI